MQHSETHLRRPQQRAYIIHDGRRAFVARSRRVTRGLLYGYAPKFIFLYFTLGTGAFPGWSSCVYSSKNLVVRSLTNRLLISKPRSWLHASDQVLQSTAVRATLVFPSSGSTAYFRTFCICCSRQQPIPRVGHRTHGLHESWRLLNFEVSCRSKRLAKAREIKEKQRLLLEEATRLALEVESPEELAEIDTIFNSPLPKDATQRLEDVAEDSASIPEVETSPCHSAFLNLGTPVTRLMDSLPTMYHLTKAHNHHGAPSCTNLNTT